MMKRILRNTKSLVSKRNKKYAKAIARESIAEGKKLGRLAIKEIRKEAPKARRILKREANAFSKRIKKIRR